MAPSDDPQRQPRSAPAIAIPERARGRLGIRLLDPATAAPIAASPPAAADEPDRYDPPTKGEDPVEGGPVEGGPGEGDGGGDGSAGGGGDGSDWPDDQPPVPEDREPLETAYVGNHLRVAGTQQDVVDLVQQIRTFVSQDTPGIGPDAVVVRPVGRTPADWAALWGDLDDDVQRSLSDAVVTTLSIHVVVDGGQRPLPDAWPILQDLRTENPGLVAGLDHAVTVHGLFDSHPLQGLFDSHPFGGNGLFDSHSPAGVVSSYAAPGWGGRSPVAQPRWRLADEEPASGRRPVVAIMDTKVTAEKHPWFPPGVVEDDVTTGPPTDDLIGEEAARNAAAAVVNPLLGGIEPLAGHGTFIAGLIRQACPAARLRSMPLFTVDGTIGESSLAEALLLLAMRQGRALSTLDVHAAFTDVVDVVSLSLGYYHESDSEKDVEQTATLRLAVDAVRQRGITVVVSAGNDATERTCVPAAFADGGSFPRPSGSHAPMVAVGATNPGHRTIALFSNEGDWVGAWRRGVALISAFPPVNGSLNPGATVVSPTQHPVRRAGFDPDDFTDGFAVWTGTSFAAPLFAGDVAAYLASDDRALDAAPSTLFARAGDAVKAAIADGPINRGPRGG